jgi:tetratricopeptide (TPR) repeat protein
VARRGAGRLRDTGTSKAAAAWREASGRPEPQEEWIRDDDVRSEATDAVARGARTTGAPQRRTRKPPPDVADELARAAGPIQAPKLGQRLAEASRAFERERFIEARSLLKTLSQRAPGSPAVRELYGLTLYRLGQWRTAMRELEAFAAMTGSTEQHPVLADCARALKQWSRVEELWDELKAASPAPELVAEGRIVAAGALADRGRLREAIELLEPAATKTPKKPREHHLRLLYALADLRERAGDVPAARTLFRRLQSAAPDFADINQRVRALG